MEKSKFIAAKKHKSEKRIEISTLVELNRVFKMKSWIGYTKLDRLLKVS